jgi:hypothetical protein
MSATRRVHDDDLRRLVGQIDERMREARGHEREAAGIENVLLVGDANLESAGEHVEGLFLAVMDVQGRAAVGGDLDDE